MYEIIDVIHDYLFVTLRLRDVQTGVTRDWEVLGRPGGMAVRGARSERSERSRYRQAARLWGLGGIRKIKKPDLSRATRAIWLESTIVEISSL